MKVIKPVVIAEPMLISSTVPETDYATYAPATNYTIGARCIYLHVVYESIQTPNAGNVPGAAPLYWSPVAPTNRWAMFDQEISTQTAVASPLAVVVAPSALFDSLALLELTGTAVSVTVRDGLAGPIVYDYTQALDGSEVSDWLQYFYQSFIPVRDVTLTNLPLYGSAHITVSITGGGAVACGSMIIGTSFFIGDTQMGANVGISSYSRKDTSATGVTTFNKRKNSKRMSVQLWLNNFALSNVYRVLADLDATPCVWVATNAAGYELLTFFGFYRDFSLDVAYPSVSYCNLEIEGLT